MSAKEVSPEDLFQCRQCGACCKGYGGTYVTAEDTELISRYIGEDPAGFIDKYCQMSGSRPVLAQAEDGYCVFCRDGACTIHPVKPDMCRAWPFIKSVLVDVGNWRTMARACPGIQTDLSDEVITQGVRQMLKSDSKTTSGGK